MGERRKKFILALITIPQLGFCLITSIDLSAQLFIEVGELCGSNAHFLLELRRTAQLHRVRYHLEKREHRGDRDDAGDPFERAGKTIVRMPDRPNFHQWVVPHRTMNAANIKMIPRKGISLRRS